MAFQKKTVHLGEHLKIDKYQVKGTTWNKHQDQQLLSGQRRKFLRF